jgi:hypothetical protein
MAHPARAVPALLLDIETFGQGRNLRSIAMQLARAFQDNFSVSVVIFDLSLDLDGLAH